MPDQADQVSRRSVLRLSAAAAGLLAVPQLTGRAAAAVPASPAAASASPAAAAADPAARLAARIRAGIRRPVFPRRDFPVTGFGAVADGSTDATAAFAAAIDACARSGGGRVTVPAGTYLTGAIRLRSNVELHLERGSTVRFSTDPAAYPVIYCRWQGIELMNYSPFVYAYGERNIAITGQGTLDGQAGTGAWWPWAGNTSFGWKPGTPDQNDDWNALQAMAVAGTPVEQRVFGPGHYLRPNLIEPYRCENVLIEGISIVNSPMWEMNPVLCRNVLVSGVSVDSLGPNNDGCDPESCDGVLITGCTFNTGDDCIAVKSGRNQDGWRVNTPSQNILIENCAFASGHGGVTIGSEMSGGVRNVVARNLTMSSPTLQSGLRLKTNSARGGFIQDIHLTDTSMASPSTAAILIDFSYGEGPGHGHNPLVSGVHVTRLSVGSTPYALDMAGYPDDHITDVTLTDCTFTSVGKADLVQYVDGLVLTRVTENGKAVTV
jgi:polygalacturonase